MCLQIFSEDHSYERNGAVAHPLALNPPLRAVTVGLGSAILCSGSVGLMTFRVLQNNVLFTYGSDYGIPGSIHNTVQTVNISFRRTVHEAIVFFA